MMPSSSSHPPSDAEDSFAKPGEGKPSGVGGLASLMRKRKRRPGKNSAANTSCASLATVSEDAVPAASVDAVSVASLDLSPPPESKRTKRGGSSGMSRMTSLASVISTPVAKMGHALQRSFSSARLPQPSPNDSLLSLRSYHGHNASVSGPSTSSSSGHPRTPTRFFARSISSAVVQAAAANANAGAGGGPAPAAGGTDSPCGTLKRGAPGRNSASHLTPYKPPQPTPNKQRPTRYWSEQHPDTCSSLTKQQVKLQEAIYEICCGEEDLAEDMKLVLKTYGDSLQSLGILTEAEVQLIFGSLRALPALHSDLHRSLRSQRHPQTGVSGPVGRILLQWTYRIGEPYVAYCSGLVRTKAFLDARRESDKDFSDFLRRCLESPFSRRLDLWAYLDVPRSRLVKYPLLLRQVLKFSECQVECGHLATAVRHFEQVLRTVDAAMARARCQHTIARLDWLDEAQEAQCEAVKLAKEEMLEGILRNNRGTKLECHLMDTVLILGRPTTRGAANNHQGAAEGGDVPRPEVKKRLQVYRAPIPVADLVVEDLDGQSTRHGSGSSTGSGILGSSSSSSASSGSSDGRGSGKQGSFKSAFSGSGQPAKNSFRVGFRQSSSSSSAPIASNSREQRSHTLTAADEHSKRQWLTTIQKTIDSLAAKKASEAATATSRQTPSSAGGLSPASRLPKGMSSCRTALFQKKGARSSPRIKASLSHTAIESLKRSGPGGSGKRRPIRSRAQCRSLAALAAATPQQQQQQENLVPIRHLPPRQASASASATAVAAAAAAAFVQQKRQQHQPKIMTSASRKLRLATPPSAILRDSTNSSISKSSSVSSMRARTKSWGHLMARENKKRGGLNNASSEDSLAAPTSSSSGEQSCRYLTRSKARQISKSMSDLLGVA